MAKHLDNRELAAFRRDVSALKKAGVLPKDTKVRSALPHTIKDGKPLREWVKKFEAATPSGGNRAQIIKATPKQAKEFQKLDYVTNARRGHAADRIMVPAAAGSEVKIDAAGQIHVKNVKTGIETVHLPVQYHNLQQYIADVMANQAQINAMKDKNESFGFQLYGYNSKRAFPTIKMLFDYLMGYQSVAPMLRKRRSKDAREMIQNLIIVKGPDPAMFDFIKGERERKRENLRRGIRVNTSKAAKRANWPEWKKQQYREKRRLEEQKRRDKKKGK